MPFFASPHTHPESPISGSTVESMVDRAAALGRTHFSYTDPAYMTSLFRAYEYVKTYNGKEDKKGKFRPKMNFIPGVEIFFKDDECDIVSNTKANKSSYFKLSLYSTNQEQFQKLSQIVSRSKSKTVTHYGETYPAWGWKDLEEAAGYGMLAVSGDLHDIVAKHVLSDTEAAGEKVFKKLMSLFGDRYSVSLVGNEVSKTWVTLVELKLQDGTTHVLPSNSRVVTNAAKFAQAKELVDNPGKHHTLISYQKNYVTKTLKYPVKVLSAKSHSGFLPIPGGDVQLRANKYMFDLASRYGVKLLYSDYAFYSTPDDKVVQDVRLSSEDIKEHTKRHMQEGKEAVSYLVEKMGLSIQDAKNILNQNIEWANQFNNFSLNYDYRLPEVVGTGSSLDQCLAIIRSNGRLKDDPAYLERLKMEISVLSKNGKIDLTPYFLPIGDVFNFYKKQKRLTGPARGSAGGSLFLYLMGITHVDPMKYGLSFERFLSLDRVLTGSFPDVDVDLVDREPLVGADGKSGYLYGRWGDRAAQISTRIQLRLKSSIRDVNKYFNNNEKIDAEVEKLSKSLPPAPQGVSDYEFVFGFEDTDGNHTPGLIEINEDLKKYAAERPKEWEVVQKCLGISRQNSRHASAFVIADTPIASVVPTFMDNITQYEAKAVEKAKLIKYDFLVVNQLKDIEGCLNRINRKNKNEDLEIGNFIHKGQEIFIWDLPEDIEVYKSVWGGDTETLFQINTASMIPFVKKIQPKSMTDLATILALVRPGPLDFVDPDTGLTMADEYVERRNGRGTIKIPELNSLIPETYSVMVFQEQTSKVAREIGKMKPTDAEELRRIFSKKEKAKSLAMKPVFMEGAEKMVGKEKAEMIWAQMETSSRYSFNLSHATGYGMITYACMFLRHYYPLEWWASVLSNADEEEISTSLFRHVRDKVLPPDINLSGKEMEIDYENNAIRSKMTILRGLGDTVATPIIQNAPYKDLKDFIKKKVAGPSLAKKLIHVGVMDSLFPKGSDLISKMQSYEDLVLECQYEEKLASGKKVKPPKKGDVDPQYLSLHPLKDFKAKKAILPTLPISLSSIVSKHCPLLNEGTEQAPMFANDSGKASRMYTGDQLEELLKRAAISPFNKDLYFCCPGFVVDVEEFTYSKGEKKALKLFVDIDGRVSEKVMWPAWGENFVKYSSDLKKNSVVLMYMKLRVGKTEPGINSIKVIA